MSEVVLKLVHVKKGRLVSLFATGCLEVEYQINVISRPPQFLASLGCGIFVYRLIDDIKQIEQDKFGRVSLPPNTLLLAGSAQLSPAPKKILFMDETNPTLLTEAEVEKNMKAYEPSELERGTHFCSWFMPTQIVHDHRLSFSQ